MTTDLFAGTAQSDGEGITFGDMNDAPRFGMARLFDQLIENLIGDFSLTGALDPAASGARGANAPTHLAYALHGGSAYLRLGGANNRVQIAPGVLFQKIGNQSGAEPTLIPYSFVGTEEVSITAGDATNPRVDLVQMKLEWVAADSQTRDFQDAVTGAYTTTATNKKRRVQCTLSVKVGTPAATPVYPDPDAGFVAVAGVLVMQTYAIGTALRFNWEAGAGTATVHDQRMPIRASVIEINPKVAALVTAWAQLSAGPTITSSSTTNNVQLRIPCGSTERFLGLDVQKDAGAWTSSIVSTQDPTNGIGAAAGSANNKCPMGAAGQVIVPYYTMEANYANSGLSVANITPSTTNKIGVPLWGSGRCAIPHTVSATAVIGLVWVVLSGSATSIILSARALIARGL